jgi:hypothetical protein
MNETNKFDDDSGKQSATAWEAVTLAENRFTVQQLQPETPDQRQ